MKYINTFDPNSIVVFQGDHGLQDENFIGKFTTNLQL